MPTIVFVDGTTPIPASWLNDVDGVTFVTVPAILAALLLKAPLDSPAFTTPDLGTPSAGDLSNCNGYAPSLAVGAADSAPPSYASLTCVEAANALTISVPDGYISFRDTSLPSGLRNLILAAGITDLVIPTTSNLGMSTSGVSNAYAILLAYNAGTPVICISNIAGGLQLDERNLISPTTISGASNSATTIYSAVACAANSPYVVIGVVDAVFTTGTGWSAPSLVQPGRQELLLTKTVYTSQVTPTPTTNPIVISVAHGLGVRLRDARLQLVCLTGELGFTAGDVITSGINTGGSLNPVTMGFDATNVWLTGAGVGGFSVARKDTGTLSNITAANWAYRFALFT